MRLYETGDDHSNEQSYGSIDIVHHVAGKIAYGLADTGGIAGDHIESLLPKLEVLGSITVQIESEIGFGRLQRL